MLAMAGLCAIGATARPVRISMIGDSITAGVCADKTKGYPAILQGLLGDGYVVGNYGNSGKTMLKRGLCGPPAGGDCAYWDTDSWPDSLTSQPDIVTIMLGTNDAKFFNIGNATINPVTAGVSEFQRDFTAMVATLKSLVPCASRVALRESAHPVAWRSVAEAGEGSPAPSTSVDVWALRGCERMPLRSALMRTRLGDHTTRARSTRLGDHTTRARSIWHGLS